MDNTHIDFVCDGPPGPDGGRFVEVEDANGNSLKVGSWLQRPDGNWTLRITVAEFGKAAATAVPKRS